jgi:hypothetical protein
LGVFWHCQPGSGDGEYLVLGAGVAAGAAIILETVERACKDWFEGVLFIA